MRKQFLILFVGLAIGNTIQAQTRGTKIGFIDMEYILQNVPDYTEAQNQLEQKAQEWKQQVEAKKNSISKLKDALKAEQALLTKELIDERQAEINYLENENLDYQQKRFGPNGDLMLQKSVLTKPIQDQVFTAVQDIAESKKYDFIFDKTSDLTMLFAAKRFDISDQVLRILNRTEKREQLTKKELAAEQARELKEDAIDENPALAERKKALDEKKAARDKALEDRKVLEAQKKKETEDRKKQLLIDREAKKSGVTPDSKTSIITSETDKETAKTAAAEAKRKQEEEKAKTIEDRKKAVEERKKAVEEKRKQLLEERETKKGMITPAGSKTAAIVPEKSVNDSKTTTAAEEKQKQAEEKAKTIEDRKKAVEDQKKALEEKRKQILEEREAQKSGVTPAASKTSAIVPEKNVDVSKTTAAAEAKQKQAEEKAKTIEDRKKVVDNQKKASEEKRKQILLEREAKKTGTVSEPKIIEDIKAPAIATDSSKTIVPEKISVEDTKKKQMEARSKILEDRKKAIEDNKKALEEKKKKVLEDREAAKKANEEKLKATK